MAGHDADAGAADEPSILTNQPPFAPDEDRREGEVLCAAADAALREAPV